jgi:tetratricopeptide (TPR) repeat protein
MNLIIKRNCWLILFLFVIIFSIDFKTNGEGLKLKTKITGTIVDNYYVSPDHSFKVKVPVEGNLGGKVSDRLLGPENIIVAFTDDFGDMYLIQSSIGGKSCEQKNIEEKILSTYVSEESVTTERGKETWMQHFLKEGSPIVSRHLTGKTENERKPKRLDLYLTKTCIQIGSRIFIVSAGVTAKTNDKKSRLLKASKEKLEVFLEGLKIPQTTGHKELDAARKWEDLGKACYSKGQYEKSKEYFEKALEIKLKTYGDEHPEVAIILVILGNTWKSLGKYEEAIQYYEKALKIDSKIYGEKNPAVARDFIHLGNSWRSLGKYEKAIDYHLKVLDIFIETYGDENMNVANALENLAYSWDSLGNYKKAVYYLEKALDIFIKTYSDKHTEVAKRMAILGDCWSKLGKYKKAIGYYEKALTVFENTVGNDHQATKKVREQLAKAQEELKD